MYSQSNQTLPRGYHRTRAISTPTSQYASSAKKPALTATAVKIYDTLTFKAQRDAKQHEKVGDRLHDARLPSEAQPPWYTWESFPSSPGANRDATLPLWPDGAVYQSFYNSRSDVRTLNCDDTRTRTSSKETRSKKPADFVRHRPVPLTEVPERSIRRVRRMSDLSSPPSSPTTPKPPQQHERGLLAPTVTSTHYMSSRRGTERRGAKYGYCWSSSPGGLRKFI